MAKTNVCKYALYRFTRREGGTTERALRARLSMINPVPTHVACTRREVEYSEFGEKPDTKSKPFRKMRGIRFAADDGNPFYPVRISQCICLVVRVRRKTKQNTSKSTRALEHE